MRVYILIKVSKTCIKNRTLIVTCQKFIPYNECRKNYMQTVGVDSMRIKTCQKNQQQPKHANILILNSETSFIMYRDIHVI